MTFQLRSLVLVVSVGVCAIATRAEVSVDVHGTAVNAIVMGVIADGSDPIGATVWQSMRSIAPERVLNATGYVRGDGRPDLALSVSGFPIVTWAYATGADHDIVVSEWTGAEWGALSFLTIGEGDDLDPRIHIEPDGTVHVVWWVDGPLPRVFLATRSTVSGVWGAPVEIGSGGRRPSVSMFDGILRISYERDSSIVEMAQDVVVSRRDTGGTFTEEFVASTIRTERLDTVLHTSELKLWLDWKHGVQSFGCAHFDEGAWVTLDEPAWTDPSWVGVEGTRRVIQRQVLEN